MEGAKFSFILNKNQNKTQKQGELVTSSGVYRDSVEIDLETIKQVIKLAFSLRSNVFIALM